MISIPKPTIAILILLIPFDLSALNLSNSFNKETKASINSVETYKSYRLKQLEQLKNQGMDPKIYALEINRLENMAQSLPLLNSKSNFELNFNIEETTRLDHELIKTYLQNIKE
tara:strand:+ start:112 stop:453 length:342 start_codon:yes stop_codon:yes gene_type:complete